MVATNPGSFVVSLLRMTKKGKVSLDDRKETSLRMTARQRQRNSVPEPLGQMPQQGRWGTSRGGKGGGIGKPPPSSFVHFLQEMDRKKSVVTLRYCLLWRCVRKAALPALTALTGGSFVTSFLRMTAIGKFLRMTIQSCHSERSEESPGRLLIRGILRRFTPQDDKKGEGFSG